MLTRVEMKGFKCLHDVDVDLGPFNVLIGPNDSGKSSFLQAWWSRRTNASGGMRKGDCRLVQSRSVRVSWMLGRRSVDREERSRRCRAQLSRRDIDPEPPAAQRFTRQRSLHISEPLMLEPMEIARPRLMARVALVEDRRDPRTGRDRSPRAPRLVIASALRCDPEGDAATSRRAASTRLSSASTPERATRSRSACTTARSSRRASCRRASSLSSPSSASSTARTPPPCS